VTFTVQHIRLAHGDDVDGALILEGDTLIAVLSQLSFDHGARAGRWFLECGFGPAFDGAEDFADLQAACDWIVDRQTSDDRRKTDFSKRRKG